MGQLIEVPAFLEPPQPRFMPDYMKAPPTPTEKFWAKVVRDPETDCWEWTGALNNNGYGKFTVANRRAEYAHRIMHEMMIGPLLPGMHIDHLCRNRACVNPAHLEQVTPRENALRGESPAAKHARITHCPQGHAYDEANTLRYPSGGRACRTCRNNPLPFDEAKHKHGPRGLPARMPVRGVCRGETNDVLQLLEAEPQQGQVVMGAVIAVPAWLDPPRTCLGCNHSSDLHRTANGQCTAEVLDVEHHSWMRCGCQGWRA